MRSRSLPVQTYSPAGPHTGIRRPRQGRIAETSCTSEGLVLRVRGKEEEVRVRGTVDMMRDDGELK